MRLYHRYLNIYRTKQTGWQYSDIILCTHLQMTTLPVVHLVGCVQRCVKNTVCSRDFSVHTLQVHRPLKMSHNFPTAYQKSINNSQDTMENNFLLFMRLFYDRDLPGSIVHKYSYLLVYYIFLKINLHIYLNGYFLHFCDTFCWLKSQCVCLS